MVWVRLIKKALSKGRITVAGNYHTRGSVAIRPSNRALMCSTLSRAFSKKVDLSEDRLFPAKNHRKQLTGQ